MGKKNAKTERRHLRRQTVAIPALVYAESQPWQGEVLSISKRGLFVRSLSIPAVGSSLRIVLKLPVDCRWGRGEEMIQKLEVAGHVRWTTDQLESGTYRHPGFGFLIEEWDSDFQEFFERLLFS